MILPRLVSILFVACLAATANSQTHGRQAHVIDGDTLELANPRTRVRLHGIDAPEAHQRCQDGRGTTYRCGAMASEHLRTLIAADKIACQAGRKDRYGRVIARCTARGADLGEAMVEAGWAVAYRRYTQKYVPAETRARAQRRGLWSGRFVPPEKWRRGARLDSQ